MSVQHAANDRGLGVRDGLANAQLAQLVAAAKYDADVNATGTLTVADMGITNSHLTQALPLP